MENPFSVNWLSGWTFQLVLIGERVNIEAKGYGITLCSKFFPGESPQIAADRLVYKEDSRRKSLKKSWLRKNI